jgi:hypothetical protein
MDKQEITRMTNIKLFEEKKVRSIWNEAEQKWYFSVSDVVSVLTESTDAKAYWRQLKKREPQLVTNCHGLKLRALDGKPASETELSRNIYQRGVDQQGFGRIRSKGDQALFGGSNHTEAMKNKLGVPKGRALADFLPTVTIAAKNLATEITNHNVSKQNLHGERSITTEHVTNNKNVRKLLGDSGIKPEALPPEEDIKKLERRVKSQEKQLAKHARLLDKN